MGGRKIVDCQIVQLFLVRMGVIIDELFTRQSWKWKSNACLGILRLPYLFCTLKLFPLNNINDCY